MSAPADAGAPAPPPRVPPPGEVHVWRVALDAAADRIEALASHLDRDEAERAARFRFDIDRIRFVACRGTLRSILARCLDLPPGAVGFEYSAHGKPRLAARHGSRLRFNVSHSGGIALIALACGRDVGVDVEHIRPDVLEDGIAERYFPAPDTHEIRAHDPTDRPAAFFECWVRKEACIKAWGEGLSIGLASFDVSGGVDAIEDPRTPGADGQAPSRWALRMLEVASGYRAAVVAEGVDWTPALRL